VLALGVLGSALAIGLQMWAQARTSAVRAALLFATEPVFAAACRWCSSASRTPRRSAQAER